MFQICDPEGKDVSEIKACYEHASSQAEIIKDTYVSAKTTLGELGNTLTARPSTSPPALMWAKGGARLPYGDDPGTIRVVG